MPGALGPVLVGGAAVIEDVVVQVLHVAGLEAVGDAELVAEVAAAVKKRRPELRFETIAYASCVAPPTNAPMGREVLVDFCPIGQCFEVQIHDAQSPKNAAESSMDVVGTTALGDAEPNPFNPVTRISFSVSEASKVRIGVYDVNGKLVKSLVNSRMERGRYSTIWDATNMYGKSMASGLYICRMEAGRFVTQKKLILLK